MRGVRALPHGEPRRRRRVRAEAPARRGGDAACVAARLRDKAMRGLGYACGVMVVLFPVLLMAAACAWAARLALGAFGAL